MPITSTDEDEPIQTRNTERLWTIDNESVENFIKEHNVIQM